jgi:hypothetical protein
MSVTESTATAALLARSQTGDLRRRRASWRPNVGPRPEAHVRSTPEKGEMFARGSTARGTIEYLRERVDDRVADRVLEQLTPAERKQLTSARDTTELPYAMLVHLWHIVDAEIGKTHPQWIEASGAWAIEQTGMRLYSGLIKKPSPLEFLSQQTSLFHLYYRPGDMVLVEQSSGRAVVRLVGFDPADPLFCRRLSGGWPAALTIAGGRSVQCVHSRCSLEGDLFCEWELRWK